LIGLAIAGTVIVPAVGLVGALGQSWLRGAPAGGTPLAAGSALGWLAGGLLAEAGRLVPAPPATGVYAGASARMPVLGTATSDLLGYLTVTAGVLVLCAVRRRFGGHSAAQGAGWGLLLAASI